MKKIYTLLAVAALTAGAAMPAHAAWNKQYVKIMLDPGHGGSDPGAGRSGYPYEHDLVLRCCNAMKGWLEGQGLNSGTLKLTRTGNYDVSLSSRRQQSISFDPWVFCSVHLNAFNGTANGTETWYYWANRSPVLAKKVQSKLVSKLGRVNRGVKQNGWTVITGASYIPAILTEGLFVDNVTENNMINSNDKAGFKAWVNGHLQGFKDFMNSESAGITGDANYGGSAPVTPPTTKTPTISCTTSLTFNCYVGEHPELDLDITGKDCTGDITVTCHSGRYNIVGGSGTLGQATSKTLGKTGGTVKVRLHMSSEAGEWNLDGKTNFMRIDVASSGATTKKVMLAAKIKPNPLKPVEKWNLSEAKNNKTSKGYDASEIRNFCYKDGKIYGVYNHKDIIVLNAQTGEKLGFMKRGDVVKGGTLQLCDVKTISGKIVACNLATASSNENLRLYAWDSDNANPYLVKEITPSEFHGASRLGDCLELFGDWNTDVWFSFGNENGKTRIIEWNKKGNNWTSQSYEVVTQYGTTQTNLSTMSTVRVYHQTGGWWIDGKDSYPTWTKLSDGKAVRQTYVDTGESWGSSHHEFNYNGQKHSINLVFEGKQYTSTGALDATKNYIKGRMRIIQDLSGDFTRMQSVGDYPAGDGLGATSRNTNATGDCFVNTNGTDYLEAWVLSTKQGMAYYAHGAVPKQTPAKLDLQEPETSSGTVTPDPKPDTDPTPVVTELGTLSEKWHYSIAKNNIPSWFNTTDNYSRSATIVGDQVVLANYKAWGSAPSIKAINIDDPNTVTDVDKTGIAGGTIIVGSLATLNGKLIACNSAATNHDFKVYMWKNGLNQAPTVILNVAAGTIPVPVGDNMYISNGRLAVAGQDGTNIKVVWFQINADGSINATPNIITVAAAAKTLGSRSAQSVYFEKDGSFWLNNKDMHPTHISADGQTVLHTIGTSDKTYGSGGDIFTYGDHRYYVATHSLGSAAASSAAVWHNVSTRVLDITDPAKPVDKGTYPAAGLGEGNWATAGNTDVKTDVNEFKTDYQRVSFVTVAPLQGITLYQFEGRYTGIEDITVDEAAGDTEAVYYNLQGVRMNGSNLAPGFYIRRAGNKAAKVLVK